jgi:hypothetical protein
LVVKVKDVFGEKNFVVVVVVVVVVVLDSKLLYDVTHTQPLLLHGEDIL